MPESARRGRAAALPIGATRSIWTALTTAIAVTAGLALLPACSGDPEEGPGKIYWSRDVCTRCQMAVGDRRYAVQVRDAHDHALHSFDDLGCALLWLEQDAPELGMSELWVRDATGTSWLDGRSARYIGGQRTPMSYGYGTAPEGAAESLGLDQVRQEILAREDERRSGRP